MKSKSLASLQETTIAKIVGLAVGFFFAFASPIDTFAEAHAASGGYPQDRRVRRPPSARRESTRSRNWCLPIGP